ncbi:MAG TPA: Gfo/Idh/MocA family oxidoreductase [Caldilineaceae bacterium]|mgnify:CR=1 FL=1|nr:Gfo/Idh/MocA family oxidoreductase [Caldilineaceae bacterium]
MSKQVRIGLIGASWYADGMHLPSLTSHPQANVVAICARRREPAEALAQKYGVAQVYTDHQAMFDSANLDAVVIAAPDDQHFALTMAALDAGLHVICEKELALTAEQAWQMAERAEQAGVKNMTFFTFRWLPHTLALAELLRSGYVGRIYHCHISYVAGMGRDGAYKWRFDGERSNGILGDLGSHLIDLARWYCGDFRRVSANLGAFVERPGAPANDSAMLLLEAQSGAQVHVHASAVAHVGKEGLQQRISIYGDEGTLEADFFFGNFSGSGEMQAIRGVRHDQRQFEALPIPDHIWGEVDHADPMGVFTKQPAGDRYFIDAILADQPVTPSFRDGAAVQSVIDAALESHRTGRWVAV